MGKTKYEKLGIDYVLKDTPPLENQQALAARQLILSAIRENQSLQPPPEITRLPIVPFLFHGHMIFHLNIC